MTKFELPMTEPQTSFGLALGGGAVLGIAHLGVLKSLSEHGLSPTHLSGTSIGAIIAAIYTFEPDPEAISEALSQLDWWTLSSFSWSKHGFMNNAAMGQFVRRFIGDKDFKDAPCPLAFIATDLARREKVILDSGDIANAAMISACVPGMYSPVDRDDQLLVDGGLVENVPITPLKQWNVDFVMGVDLNGSTRRREPEGMFDALITAFDIAIDSHTRTQLTQADFVLSLDLADYNRTDPSRSEDLFKEGYDACNQAMDEIKQKLEAKSPGVLERISRSLSKISL
ncbi:patatin [gamma proteobacterium HTCC5015]|nr:patatin [gamma proteobacterium HTCC5015]